MNPVKAPGWQAVSPFFEPIREKRHQSSLCLDRRSPKTPRILVPDSILEGPQGPDSRVETSAALLPACPVRSAVGPQSRFRRALSGRGSKTHRSHPWSPRFLVGAGLLPVQLPRHSAGPWPQPRPGLPPQPWPLPRPLLEPWPRLQPVPPPQMPPAPQPNLPLTVIRHLNPSKSRHRHRHQLWNRSRYSVWGRSYGWFESPRSFRTLPPSSEDHSTDRSQTLHMTFQLC